MLLHADTTTKIENKFARTLLVRRIAEERIDPRFARQFIKQCWGIGGEMFELQMRSARVFLFQFRKMKDYIKVRDMGYTWMNGVFTIIKSWKEGKMIEKELIGRLPIWVTMPRFPIHL